jgi:hypothetical protein
MFVDPFKNIKNLLEQNKKLLKEKERLTTTLTSISADRDEKFIENTALKKRIKTLLAAFAVVVIALLCVIGYVSFTG